MDKMPALLAPAIVDGGFCFGPLDPVSNIIANAVRHLPPSGADVEEFGMRQGFTKDGDREGFGMSHPFANEAVQRSIKALVGFLAFYFRYLPTLEAQHYLFAAKGDLLAAVHLVEAERCTGAFDVGSHTTKTMISREPVLNCHGATLKTMHPQLTIINILVDINPNWVMNHN
uniref:PIR2-like helical domain-containing protein n=1 Tax=Oryza brachyantha TaxID=4533 RepID=J3N236_ORYBR